MRTQDVVKVIIFIGVALAGFAGYFAYSAWQPDTWHLEPTTCTQEAKLCPDGSSVERTSPSCNFAPCPKEDLIQIESPHPFEPIGSPLLLNGRARGFWFFEASFPVRLFDESGKELAVTMATAQTDWMTTNFVAFSAEMHFPFPTTETGYLIFEKDNPSGLPEHDDSLIVPVRFSRHVQP